MVTLEDRIAKIWTEEAKYKRWARVEMAVTRGLYPDAWERFGEKILAYRYWADKCDAEAKHDVIEFLRVIEGLIGNDSRFVHQGLTSSDVVDTALSLAICDSLYTLWNEMSKWHTAYGQLHQAMDVIRFGKLSGAVGNCAHIDPDMERHILATLDLEPEPAASQVISRDRHAEVLTRIALAANAIDARAPQATILRANASASWSNIALWHERDISHSSVERIIFPQSFALLAQMVDAR